MADSPRIAVGAADGAEEYLISWIWDALLLGNGTLVVGNAGGHDVRLYDTAGQFVRRTGREGAGPGEFGAFSDLQMWRLPGGELAVRDPSLLRVNVFDTTGVFRRTVTFTPPDSAARPTAIGSFADGSYVASASEADDRQAPGRVSRSYAQYLRYDRNGGILGTFLRVEMAPHMAHELGGMMHFPYLPFTVDPLVVTDSQSVLLLRRGEPVIERYDPAGKLVERIAWSPPRRRITPELYRRLVAGDLGATPDPQQKRLWQHYYDQDLPLPEVVPAYQRLYVDETRHLWVERYRLPGEGGRVWDVIGPDGRWLGPVKLPGGFWLHRAGAEFLVGTQTDSLDVERVQVHALRRHR
ncbi:MAG: hypothetical protein HOP28_15725 [Gemmatimonadales bacterium]|nr:hypothetical protein [Gemmatimonadales bacterium]